MGLKQRQANEKRRIIDQYIPEGLAKEVFTENVEEVEDEMQRFKQEMEDRRARELESLEEREKVLKDQSAMYQD